MSAGDKLLAGYHFAKLNAVGRVFCRTCNARVLLRSLTLLAHQKAVKTSLLSSTVPAQTGLGKEGSRQCLRGLHRRASTASSRFARHLSASLAGSWSGFVHRYNSTVTSSHGQNTNVP